MFVSNFSFSFIYPKCTKKFDTCQKIIQNQFFAGNSYAANERDRPRYLCNMLIQPKKETCALVIESPHSLLSRRSGTKRAPKQWINMQEIFQPQQVHIPSIYNKGMPCFSARHWRAKKFGLLFVGIILRLGMPQLVVFARSVGYKLIVAAALN